MLCDANWLSSQLSKCARMQTCEQADASSMMMVLTCFLFRPGMHADTLS